MAPEELVVVVTPVIPARTVLRTRFTDTDPAAPVPCWPPPPVATPSDAVTLMIRAALVATTSTAPVWVRFATDSIPAVVVLLMLPKARPTP